MGEDWKTKIRDALSKHHIDADFQPWSNEDELNKVLENINQSSINSLIVIGNDQDFTALVGASGALDETIAIGYIPITNSHIATKLQIKNWEGAIGAISQRRIHEATVFSIGKRYFLDSIELNTAPTDTSRPLIISVNSSLTLRLPLCQLKFENLSDDPYLNKSPILFSARPAKRTEEIKKDLLGGLRDKLRLNSPPKAQPIASLHGRLFRIESASSISDDQGYNYKNSVWIGKKSQKLRLITGKPQQPS